MKIKLTVDYNEEHKKGSDGNGLPDDLKRALVQSGLAVRTDTASKAKSSEPAPAKPKARSKSKGRTATRLAVAAPAGHRPLVGPASEPTPAAQDIQDEPEQ